MELIIERGALKTKLAGRISAIETRIAEACAKSGRSKEDVSLVAVSKSVDAETISIAADLGLKIFGENRPQVLKEKQAWFAANRPDLLEKIQWHMIGHLQRNKAKICAELCTLIHSVDSVRLAEKLNNVGLASGKKISVLAQVKISIDENKQGVHLSDAGHFIEHLISLENLSLEGIMGMASFSKDQVLVASEFQMLRLVFDDAREKLRENVLSMGMSGDFPLAIENGATHVRVGSAIFGP